MKDLLTIIVPFYCTPQFFFHRCMSSILENDISNIELIIIDDGSPDEYQDAFKSIQDDKRVRIIHISNSGVSSARNRGIREATGKWLTFVDSDDYVNSETLREIANNLECLTGEINIYKGGLDNGKNIIRNTYFLNENVNYGFNYKDKLSVLGSALSVGIYPQGYIQNFSLGAPYCKIFKTDFLINNKLYFDEDVKFAEDTLFSLFTYKYAKKIFYHDKYFYNYVVNINSVTRKFRPGLSKDMDVFFNRIKSFLVENNLYHDLEIAYFTRVQLEVGRCFYLEFFNLQNKDSNSQKAYRMFIRKEPYKTALIKNYLPKSNCKTWIFNILVKYGFGDTYNFIRHIRKKV